MSSVFFPFFLENDLLKVDKTLGLTFFKGKKRLQRTQNGVFPFTVAEFYARWIVYNFRLFAYKRSFHELSVS